MSGLIYALVSYSILGAILCSYLFKQISEIRSLEREIGRYDDNNRSYE